MILHVLIAMIAGRLQRNQQQVITYLLEENRVLKAHLRGSRLRLTDTERRRLAALAHPLGRKCLKEIATLVTPDTLLRWYKRLIAAKFDGSTQRRLCGRPRVAEEIEQLVIQMATDNPTWVSCGLQGALANLGHPIDKLTVRNILRRHRKQREVLESDASLIEIDLLRSGERLLPNAEEVRLDLKGAYFNLDGGFDSARNRKMIFNAGMIPNIKENPRNRKTPQARAETVVQCGDPCLTNASGADLCVGR